jgi:hypothetical protein
MVGIVGASLRVANAGAGAAGIDQPAIGIVVAEQQSPEPGPGAFGIGPADHHELLAVHALDLDPQTAIFGRVRSNRGL